ncbi:hypothetical protein D3874_02110 [Oleomonas cavernae]|uniref:Uncharacterized protein n=1 Tax=Oleomonas cavernae TaxID=2320859 RepID=A0A418WTP3_9PROT|nr:hypothetical protein [Oleomonas cavernae]RJF94644.1 hypothetical protein D3874_02110 [Oleomonas cavernae]
MATTKHDLEKVQAALDLIDEVEADSLGPGVTDADVDRWFRDNREALAQSILKGNEAIARGEYRDGTPAEHRAYFLEKFRRRSTDA